MRYAPLSCFCCRCGTASGLAGFGPIRLLPGIADQVVINSTITLPIGVEAYAAYAIWAWLAPPSAGVSPTARRFACWSALGAGASPRLEF
jgi:hypothetical protein